MLYNRIASTFVLIPFIVLILFFFSKTQFLIFLLSICLISSWEWGKLMSFSSSVQFLWMCTIFSLLSSVAVLSIIDQNYIYANFWSICFGMGSLSVIWWMFMFMLVVLYPNYFVFWSKSDVLKFFFGILMIFPFFFAVLVLNECNFLMLDMSGKWWLLYILILVWINDSSAYLIGKTVGKHKLLRHVSPKKTWEGCIGGIIISAGSSWLFVKYTITISIMSSDMLFLFFIGTILFSVIGDLTESMFKRESGVKDTSNLIPGHGGLLDRIDSLLSAVPVFTVLILSSVYIKTISI